MKTLQSISNDILSESVITFDNLTFELTNQKNFSKQGINKRTILKNIQGNFPRGLNAILGSSGAGKTTLLNILAKRIENSKNAELKGKIMINNHEYSTNDFSKFAGYVMQDDLLLANLTVREYIKFAADLRLDMTEEKRIEKTQSIIKLLQLERCQNSLIGSEIVKGISGGERKRVSIGLELIGEPRVLFLDEPTSGLDSFTAYKVMQILKNIAQKKNNTIIFTIHQPSSDIWNLFDKVFFLVEGQFIYQGQRENVIDYFSQIGFQCPIHNNPPDYIMRIISLYPSKYEEMWKYFQEYQQTHDFGTKCIASKELIIPTQFTQTEIKIINTEFDEETHLKNNQLSNLPKSLVTKSFFEMTRILINRQLLNLKRHKIMIRARSFQVLIMGLFNVLLFYKINSDFNYLEGTLQRATVLYLYPLGMLFQSINPQVISFTADRPVFLKEQGAGMYTTISYFTSKVIPELFSCSIFGLVFGSIFYFAVGLREDPQYFFFFILILVLISNIGNAMGLLFGSVFRSPKLAISLTTIFVVPYLLFGGLIKNRADYPKWIGWFEYLNPTYYAWTALAHNEFDGLPYKYDALKIFNLDLEKWKSVGILVVLYFSYLLLAYLFLIRHTKKKLQ